MRYIPYIMTAFSVAGTIANSFQKKWCFWLWICTNIFWCGYNVLNTQYAQALLYVFNFVMCIVGLIKWQIPKSQDRIRRCDDCRYKTIPVIPELPSYKTQNTEIQAERQEAANEPEDPKILHWAYNAPKYRTRKKNLSRLKREYRKYIKKGSGGQ